MGGPRHFGVDLEDLGVPRHFWDKFRGFWGAPTYGGRRYFGVNPPGFGVCPFGAEPPKLSPDFGGVPPFWGEPPGFWGVL